MASICLTKLEVAVSGREDWAWVDVEAEGAFGPVGWDGVLWEGSAEGVLVLILALLA